MDLPDFLKSCTSRLDTAQALGHCLQQLVDAGLDQLPLPGAGQTLQRWQQLALVARHDLGLCKLYEGHTDALATMRELNAAPVARGSTWGMWAAEPPDARAHVLEHNGRILLSGRKAWCSGAGVVSHGLLTAWDEQERQQLVAVDMRHPGVSVGTAGWDAVGMAATASVDIEFEQVPGLRIGHPDDYVQRCGFWHGAIGIAACWHGAASALAEALQQHCDKRNEPHALAHLGAVDAALFSARSVLGECARQLDQYPGHDAQRLARQARAHIEHCVDQVLVHVGRALGARPYCKDPHFARLIADLPVYLRQSHAERDLQALGEQAARQPVLQWPL